MSDVLAFDSLRGRWEFRFALKRPRHGVAAASADDRVYVFGGMTCLEGVSVDTVDVYHRQRLSFLDCECLPKSLTGTPAGLCTYIGLVSIASVLKSSRSANTLIVSHVVDHSVKRLSKTSGH